MGDIVGILLAAGIGSRFGGNKLLHPLADGTPLGVASARSLRAALDRVVAVTRPGDDKLADLLAKAGCEVIVAHDAAQGMGHSLAAGVRAAPDAGGWMIALGDMPCIKPETHRLISQALQAGGSIVAPVCNGVRGHPVAFGAKWYGGLSTLRGDTGAKELIRSAGLEFRQIEVRDRGIVEDVDVKAEGGVAI